MDNSFMLLKLKLLLQALDRVPDSELHALVIQQAELASRQAAATTFPSLVFPCLFEERTAQALQLEHCRRRDYWYRLAVVGREAGATRCVV